MEYVNHGTPIKLMEGWLQHKNAQESKWIQYWCVLKDSVIYIFKTQETSKDTHIGVLTIGSDSQVKIGDSDPKRGYRFDLYTTKKLNKFKTTKFIERELWKAYITGLAEGDISDNFDLLPEQIQKVRSDVQRVMSRSTRLPIPVTTRSNLDNSSVSTGFHSPDSSITSMFDNKSQTSMSDGGPTIRHKFWPNPERTEVPSWFFTAITRDTAETILTMGHGYGNTLMRESVTFRDTGSYVITKKMEHSRGPPFNHFEVIRVSEGFKINVENAHKSMKCLQDIMDYFVTMSGCAVTRPMVTNDLKVLGLDIPDYDTKIWKSKTNAESGEEDIVPDYPREDYEEPVTQPAPRETSSNLKTWGPSSKQARESKRAVRGGVTMGVGPGPRSRVTEESMQQRVAAANVMSELDSTLESFSSGLPNTRRQVQKSPSQEYYNESDVLDRLGPAPPPPCSLETTTSPRWHNRAKSVPNLQIPASLQLLNQEVPVSQTGPSLVKPVRNPPRALPKPPQEPKSPSGSQGEGQTMTALQRQLQAVNLRQAEKKPSVPNRNTWHQHHRQQLPSRSYSTSVALGEDDSALTTKPRSHSESDTTDDYYDDAVGLTLTEVTFDLGGKCSSDPIPEKEEENSDPVVDRAAFKKKLEMMIGGGGAMPSKMMPRSKPSLPSQQSTEAEEEQYDEVIYEDPDDLK